MPTEKAVEIALRTQQILAGESGVGDVVDPLGGSYYIEWLTDEIERQVCDYLERIDEMGGAMQAVADGFIQREIQESAYASLARCRERHTDRCRRQSLPGRGCAPRRNPARRRGRAE